MHSKNFYIILLYFIIFLSGFAGLGYEMVWTRMLSIEIVAVLAVIAAFFCGLALGVLMLDRLVSSSPMPGKWYALLELIIGVWSLALVIIIPWGNKYVYRSPSTADSELYKYDLYSYGPDGKESDDDIGGRPGQ